MTLKESTLHYDKPIKITIGNSRKATQWKKQELTWSEFLKKISEPVRTVESFETYKSMPDEDRKELKDVGGFMGGSLKGTRRLKTEVIERYLITLDADDIESYGTQKVVDSMESMGYAYAIYSTRSHCSAIPRLRILIPLNSPCSANDYETIARGVAQKITELIGSDIFDSTTFGVERLMYWPSSSVDGEFVFTYGDKPFVEGCTFIPDPFENNKFELPDEILEGSRDSTIYKYACSLQAKGASDEDIYGLVHKANNERCKPPLEDKDVDIKIMSALTKPKGGSETDLSKFHKFNAKGEPTGVFDINIVADIIQNEHFFIIGDTFFVYENGAYSEDPKGLGVKHWIQKRIYPRFITSRTIDSIYRLLSYRNENQKKFSELNNYPSSWINFKNGMLDVINWKIKNHSPAYFSINQIPHEFNLSKPTKHKNIDVYLAEAIGPMDDIEMMLAFVGHCMVKDISFEKFMLLKGRGGTGKSILIKLINAAIGRRNISSISLQKLNERFYAIELMGKLLNACADIPGDVMKSVDIIKQLVSGDLMMGERKGKDPISFCNSAKLLFSGNELPLNLDESSNAFYRRLLILKMDTQPKRIDTSLEEKLLGELDYFIYKSVEALSNAYMFGQLTESVSSKEEVKLLHKYSDTVAAFLDECTSREEGIRINRVVAYISYKMYCERNDRTSLGRNKFYKNLVESKGITIIKSGDDWNVCDISIDIEGSFDVE